MNFVGTVNLWPGKLGTCIIQVPGGVCQRCIKWCVNWAAYHPNLWEHKLQGQRFCCNHWLFVHTLSLATGAVRLERVHRVGLQLCTPNIFPRPFQFMGKLGIQPTVPPSFVCCSWSNSSSSLVCSLCLPSTRMQYFYAFDIRPRQRYRMRYGRNKCFIAIGPWMRNNNSHLVFAFLWSF